MPQCPCGTCTWFYTARGSDQALAFWGLVPYYAIFFLFVPCWCPSAACKCMPTQSLCANISTRKTQFMAVPEYIQTLHAEFAQHAFAWEFEMASTQVLVWFVDHRFHVPTCRFPRPVTLYEDFSDWEHRIKQAWNDFLQNDLAVEIAVVSPTPPRLEPGVAAHVIIIQAPNDDWATSLVSILTPSCYHHTWESDIRTCTPGGRMWCGLLLHSAANWLLALVRPPKDHNWAPCPGFVWL